MLIHARRTQAPERPSRLQLAIREWQRQLIAIAEAAHGGRPTQSAAVRG
jgi:hypothetical protein